MTPRQLVARMFFSDRIARFESARHMHADYVTAQGDGKAVKALMKKLTEDAP